MQSSNRQNTDASRYQTALNHWRAGDNVTAEAVLSDLLVHNPGHRDAATLLAKLNQTRGDLSRASEVAAQHCQQAEFDPQTTLQWVQFIQQCQRQPIAAELCEEAIRLGHASPELYAMAGNLLCELGRFDAARQYLSGAVERGIDLNKWFIYSVLADTRRYSSPDDADIALIERHFSSADSTPQSRAASGFALGKIFDDIGDYARAARVLREANALAGRAMSWSRENWRESIERRISNPVRNRPPAHESEVVPVFVVGMPRTGTTITARRLGMHPLTRERGELPHIGYIARRLETANLMNDVAALREAADLYLRHIRQDDAPARWYIDKNPENIRYLDLIAAMFPEAKLVVCQRGAADTALSMWSQYFAHPDQAYSYDFDNIAAFMDGNARLLNHWRKQLPLPFFTLEYEQFATGPDATLAKLRDFIGLDPDAPTDASSADQAIASNSRWQARQPVYASSVGRWRHYLPYVPELAGFAQRS